MKSRIDDVPALWVIDAEVDAAQFNRIRLALLRLGEPLRMELRHLGGLDVLRSRERCGCGDRTMDDLAVIAWTRFESAGRQQLQAPVRCRLRYYHGHAGMIVQTVLDDALAVVAQKLGAAAAGSVTPLSPKE